MQLQALRDACDDRDRAKAQAEVKRQRMLHGHMTRMLGCSVEGDAKAGEMRARAPTHRQTC